MRKVLFALIMLVAAAAAASAQTPAAMLDKAVASLRASGTVSATYSVSSPQGSYSGTIVMSGSKFRMLSRPVKCWYDGRTQWSYSVATGEVNVTTPTAADLQMVNPYAAAQGFKTNFNMWKARTQVAGSYTIKLMPKKRKSNIKQILLYIANGSCQIKKARFEMTNGTATTVTISNYKTHVSYPASTFTFSKKMVPAGVQVVDLR